MANKIHCHLFLLSISCWIMKILIIWIIQLELITYYIVIKLKIIYFLLYDGGTSPSSDSCLSLVSRSICWHQASMRSVSACRSFWNQYPSLRHAEPPGCSTAPFTLPACRDGSGGGREDGSSAGSSFSCSEGLWTLPQSRLWWGVLFCEGLPSDCSWDSASVVSCLDAMLVKRLSLDTQREETH